MLPLSLQFVCQKFSSFYERAEIESPYLMPQREFAFLLLKQRVMVRHRSFFYLGGLKSFLCGNVPSDVYHSCAYYEDPAAVIMTKKGWVGSDLVFDIDADHIPTSCNKSHDEWTCKQCELYGKGEAPQRCPKCGSERFDEKTWPCEQCLASAKEETAKLIDMLQTDFGFRNEELSAFFSGHRGYHVHVSSETSKKLDSLARKEIVDYITGLGLDVCKKSKDRLDSKATSVFHLHDYGRHRRLRQDLRQFVENVTEEGLTNAGLKRKSTITAFLEYRQQVLDRCIDGNLWTSVNGITDEVWFRLAEYLTNIASAKIDTVVTTDIHRLIRMNGTLHGKTGLMKINVPISMLDVFDPFKEAVAFKEGSAKVFVSNAPEFQLGGKMFGPYRNQEVELPTAAAILLVCKGRAEVKE